MPSLLSARGVRRRLRMVLSACFQNSGSLLVPLMLSVNLCTGVVVSTLAPRTAAAAAARPSFVRLNQGRLALVSIVPVSRRDSLV
eukprot:scaffold230398_cov35-Tisochrysis_lutea.AAC.5